MEARQQDHAEAIGEVPVTLAGTGPTLAGALPTLAGALPTLAQPRAPGTLLGASPFPPIADYAFLSDCETVALVAPGGAIEWMCLPRGSRSGGRRMVVKDSRLLQGILRAWHAIRLILPWRLALTR